MRVYRIQDANNLGPMHYLSTIRRNVIHHKDPGEMQATKGGVPIYPQIGGSAARFGWDSLEKICGFIKYPRSVDEAGYTVVVYEVDADECVLYPDGQVFFYPSKAEKVDEFLYSQALAKLLA